MPVIFSEINDNWYKHGESLLFVCLQNIQEVVVFKEAHSSICDLEMDAANAPDNSFEQSRDQVLNLLNFADFKDFL